MKANELRIGNYYAHNERIEQVTPSVIMEVWDAPRIWCKPIPLTKEWLLKLGIQYSDFEGLFQIGGYDIDAKDGSYCHFYFNEYGDWYKEIEYVHQLQNLYFALTGEELIIKE